MKIPRPLAVLPALAVFALLATACIGSENPQGWAGAVSDDQNAYFLQAHDRLAAAPLSNADAAINLTWSFPDKNNTADKDVKLQAVYGEPVLDGDRLYFSSFSGGVFALKKVDGRPIWRMKDEISGDVVGGVAVAGDLLAFGTTDGHLYLVNKADKSPARGWPRSGLSYDDGIWATPVISGDTLYVATMGGDLHAVNLADASEKWRKPFRSSGAIAELAPLGDSLLFVPSLNRHVYFIDARSGDVAGDFTASDWVWTRPAVKDKLAYFGDFSGKLYALDITSFQAAWTLDLGTNRVKSAPGIVDNVLIVGDRGPVVHFVDISQGGKLLHNVPQVDVGTLRADVMVKDGLAYLSTTKGRLLRADPGNYSVAEVTVGNRQ